MSFAYLPLYTGDYLRDTQHLSCSEHGIYLKLLMHCWDQKGPTPLDERKLCGIVNARSSDEIEALRRVLAEFFTKMEDGHYNHRMQMEIERCEAISSARSAAGTLGYQAKAKQLLSKSRARARQVPLSPSPSPSPEPIKTSNLKVASTQAQLDCPHLHVLELWAEVLPDLPRHDPEQWRGARADHLRSRWRETATLKKWQNEEAGLTYFRKLFSYVGQSEFLTGKAKSRDGKRPFVIELEWLVKPINWAKVIEGKYHAEVTA
jgi:uncharacterized protein YdaU (DUF1376 family)